jgi:hypothetical protein
MRPLGCVLLQPLVLCVWRRAGALPSTMPGRCPLLCETLATAPKLTSPTALDNEDMFHQELNLALVVIGYLRLPLDMLRDMSGGKLR